MSEGGVDHPKQGGKFLQRLVGRSRDAIVSRVSERPKDFESQLFSSGTLDFDFDSYVEEMHSDLESLREWHETTSGWSPDKVASSLASTFDDSRKELIWRQRFSGQIPRHWTIWYAVREDFKKARERDVTLSETLVDAGITHPHHLVANEVGQGQKLNTKQLAWLFVRPEFPAWNRNEILAAQRRFGMTEDDIRKAVDKANEVINSVKNLDRGNDDASLIAPYIPKLLEADKE